MLGHGWPVTACPRSGPGEREPERSDGRTLGQGLFGSFWGCLPKGTRRKGGTRRAPWRIQWIYTQTETIKRSKDQKIAACGSDYKTEITANSPHTNAAVVKSGGRCFIEYLQVFRVDLVDCAFGAQLIQRHLKFSHHLVGYVFVQRQKQFGLVEAQYRLEP